MLREKRIRCAELNPAENNISVSEKNPLGKIPTLELEDASTLYDSVVIVEYLESLVPEPVLIPKSPLERAQIRKWEALADGICDAVIFGVLEGRRAPEKQDASAVEKQHLKVSAALLAIASELKAQGGTLAGYEFSLADVATNAALGYIELRAPKLLESAPPEVVAYRARHASRPSIAQTTPDSPLVTLNG